MYLLGLIAAPVLFLVPWIWGGIEVVLGLVCMVAPSARKKLIPIMVNLTALTWLLVTSAGVDMVGLLVIMYEPGVSLVEGMIRYIVLAAGGFGIYWVGIAILQALHGWWGVGIKLKVWTVIAVISTVIRIVISIGPFVGA